MIHTDAIKENIVPTLSEKQINFVYANEVDLLNVALFGKTASEWRKENPELKGNIRDYASIEQLSGRGPDYRAVRGFSEQSSQCAVAHRLRQS